MVLNYIWIGFFAIAFLIAAIQLLMGNTDAFPAIMNSTFDNAKTAFEISLGLTGVLSLWMGIMKIGERGGLVDVLARWRAGSPRSWCASSLKYQPDIPSSDTSS